MIPDREMRVLAEWEEHQAQILRESDAKFDLACRCLACGSPVVVSEDTLVARIHDDEPARPLCSHRCAEWFAALMCAPTVGLC